MDGLEALSGLALDGWGPAVWWRPSGAGAALALGALEVLEAAGPDRFAALQLASSQLAERGHLPPAARLYGGFAFAEDVDPAGPWAAFGACRFTLPEAVLREEGGAWRLEVFGGPLGLEAWAARVRGWAARAGTGALATLRHQREPDRAAFAASVAAATAAIASSAGALEKVVLCRRLEAHLDEAADPATLLRSFAAAEPACAHFAVCPAAGAPWFVGATPEWLVRAHRGSVAVDALAGTAARGEGEALTASAKDQHEHALVVEAVVEALRGRCDDLEIPAAPALKPLRDLVHLWTPVRGRLKPGRSVLGLVEALHPTPAVCGQPRHAAQAWLAGVEREVGLERGWYTGGVGWFDLSGDGELAVGLRCGLLHGDRATLYAGAGIVEASAPEREVAETAMKMRPMLRALGQEEAT